MVTPKQLAAQELLKRRRARRGLLDFIRYLDPEYVVSDFSRMVCDALERFLNDQMAGLRPVLVLQAPPQHGKSQIVSRYLPAWLFGQNPDLSIGGLSYAKDLASDMNRDVQRIMLSPEYKRLFPEAALNSKRVVTIEVEAKRNSDVFEIVGHKGRYVSAGVGGPLTGKRLDIGIIDDPIKNAQEALSEVTKNGIWNWYITTFGTRLSKNSGQIIMATSWAQDDLSGRVIESNSRAKVMKFPAISEDGLALVPELHPIDKLLETKSLMSDYFWSAMYQQSPKTLGGNVFKDDGIQYYLPKDLPEKFDTMIASWDCTFKDTDGTDFVVGQVWGKKGANSYLLAQIRARMSFTKTVAAVDELHVAWPRARKILIEDKANGPAVIDTLKAHVPGIVPVEPDGSKLARAHAVTSYWEAKNIWLPHPDTAPWVKDLVSELTAFPAAANDDQVDALTQALRELYPLIGRMKISPEALAKAAGRR
jgi:predicted phage terminase large subunit-like protein